MNLREAPGWVRDTVLRLFPHRAPTGLRAVGTPGRDAPVLLTGNFTLTVRRLLQALAGRDVWVLVANSRGINVWCAAGGGHLTHHDVIAALRTSGIEARVDHRRVVLPQLAATGVEKRKVEEATGWEVRWGPARLEDLPAFLDRGGHVRPAERAMRFPLWERMEMAIMWTVPIASIGGLAFGAFGGARLGWVVAGLVAALVPGIFALLPWLPLSGTRRWLTYGGAAALGTLAGAAALASSGGLAASELALLAGAMALAMGVLSIDLAGTTPWYPSTINSSGENFARIDLVEERCTAAAQCVLVCPREVLRMDGRRRKVVIGKPEACIQCGACIVQCPEDALRFRYADGRIIEPATIRSTRMNLLGRRTVRVA